MRRFLFILLLCGCHRTVYESTTNMNENDWEMLAYLLEKIQNDPGTLKEKHDRIYQELDAIDGSGPLNYFLLVTHEN